MGLNVMALRGALGWRRVEPAEAAKPPAENIAEDVAQIDAAGAAEAAKAATVAAAGLAGPIVGIDPSESELVIALALVRVGKNIVGSLTSLNFSSASLSPGFRSGWYFLASLR